MLNRALPFLYGSATAIIIFVAGYSIGRYNNRYHINDGRVIDTNTGTIYVFNGEGITWVKLDGTKGSYKFK